MAKITDDGVPVIKLAEVTGEQWQILICVGPMLLLGMLAVLFVLALRASLLKHKTGTAIDRPRLDHLAGKIKTGALAFLKEEYKFLGIYVAAWFVILAVLFSLARIVEADRTDGARCAACFLVGALLSGGAGFFGMSVATDGNVRTTVACASGTLDDGLRVAFKAGSAVGFGVVGLASCGIALMLLIMSPNRTHARAIQYLHSFGFGASSIALFARVAGGIYTKAADVGADLVGKVEAGINEDDPHNPAVIADNVGDNVGDVAGMGADLFESYVGSILAAATLGAGASPARLAMPLWLAAAGLLSSLIGFFFVRTKETGNGWNTNLGSLMWALEKGMYVANGIFLARPELEY